MSRFGAVVLAVLLVVACSSVSSGPTGAVDPPIDPTTGPQPEPTTEPLDEAPSRPLSNLRVTDAVPTLEQLREMGVGDEAAACFVATIGPNNTGRVANVELFIEAMAACI